MSFWSMVEGAQNSVSRMIVKFGVQIWPRHKSANQPVHLRGWQIGSWCFFEDGEGKPATERRWVPPSLLASVGLWINLELENLPLLTDRISSDRQARQWLALLAHNRQLPKRTGRLTESNFFLLECCTALWFRVTFGQPFALLSKVQSVNYHTKLTITTIAITTDCSVFCNCNGCCN